MAASGVLNNGELKVIPLVFDVMSTFFLELAKISMLLLLIFWVVFGIFQWWDQSVSPLLTRCSEKLLNISPLTDLAPKKVVFQTFSIDAQKEEESSGNTQYVPVYLSPLIPLHQDPPGPSNSQQTNCKGPDIAEIYEKLKEYQNTIDIKSYESESLSMPNPDPILSETSSEMSVDSKENCKGPNIPKIYAKLKQRQCLIDAKIKEINALLIPQPMAIPMSTTLAQTPSNMNARVLIPNSSASNNGLNFTYINQGKDLEKVEDDSEKPTNSASAPEQQNSNIVIENSAHNFSKPLQKSCGCRNLKCKNRRL